MGQAGQGRPACVGAWSQCDLRSVALHGQKQSWALWHSKGFVALADAPQILDRFGKKTTA